MCVMCIKRKAKTNSIVLNRIDAAELSNKMSQDWFFVFAISWNCFNCTFFSSIGIYVFICKNFLYSPFLQSIYDCWIDILDMAKNTNTRSNTTNVYEVQKKKWWLKSIYVVNCMQLSCGWRRQKYANYQEICEWKKRSQRGREQEL